MKKKFGARVGQLLGDLPAQIALDQRDGGQRGQADAERDQHQRRRRAGPVQVGQAEPHGRPADAA